MAAARGAPARQPTDKRIYRVLFLTSRDSLVVDIAFGGNDVEDLQSGLVCGRRRSFLLDIDAQSEVGGLRP